VIGQFYFPFSCDWANKNFKNFVQSHHQEMKRNSVYGFRSAIEEWVLQYKQEGLSSKEAHIQAERKYFKQHRQFVCFFNTQILGSKTRN
jgi:hypothetical protein